MDNFYQRQAIGGAVFTGRTLIQAHGSIGGFKNVFVKLVKGNKDALCYPTTGATASDTTYKFVRDGYHYIPFVGDNIMVGQKDFVTKALGVTITKVEKSTEGTADIWLVTVSKTLGTEQHKGDIFVEAASAGASVLPMVTNPNAYADKDMDFLYDANMEGLDDLQYMFTPALAQEDTVIDLMAIGALPPAVLALNKSRVKSWFWFN